MASVRDRFMNNAILDCLSRPQYPYGCSVSALTTVVNYLFGDAMGLRTQEEVAARLGIEIGTMTSEEGPGNEVIIEWFDTYLDRADLAGGTPAVRIDQRDVAGDADSERLFDTLKEIVRSPDRIAMYHLPGHYNLVCGFFESAARPEEAFAPQPALRRWLVLADTSSERDPVWSVEWREVCEDLSAYRHHGFLVFSKQG